MHFRARRYLREVIKSLYDPIRPRLILYFRLRRAYRPLVAFILTLIFKMPHNWRGY